MILFVQTAYEMWLFTAHKRFLFSIENFLTALLIFKIMKKIVITIAIIFIGSSLYAQKIFVDGMPISVVNGGTNTVISTIESQNFDGIKLSNDGTKIFAYKELWKEILIIDVETNNIIDTITFTNNIYDFVPGETGFLYYSENPTTTIYKLDLSTMLIVNSVVIPQDGAALLRRRPGTSEIWTTADNDIFYFTLSDMTLNSVNSTIPSNGSTGTLEFNNDGSLLFFSSRVFGEPTDLLKMDVASETIIGTLNIPIDFGNEKYFLASDDNSTFYVNYWGVWPEEPSKIMIGDIGTMTITSTIDLSYKPFDMFEHPDGNELWVVYHYDAKIGILDRTNNLTTIENIEVGTNPKNIVFSDATLGTTDFNELIANLIVYPNPARDQILIETNSQFKRVLIIDVMGRIVKIVTPSNNIIDVSDLNKGVYILKIQTSQGAISTMFIKE